MGCRLLVIGAGWEQAELIKEAKRQGHYVIGTHPNITNEGLGLCDKFIVKDSRDINGHYELAKTYKVDGLLTDNCDYSLQTTAFVSSALGMSSASVESSKFSNNKFAQRLRCSEKGILQPAFSLVENIGEAKESGHKLGFPVILKPVDSRGTFGVTIVRERDELEAAFLSAVMHSPSRRVICENYIEGKLVTVDGFCFKNGHKSLTVASRIFAKGSKPVTREIIYPAELSVELIRKLQENHHSVVGALDYKFGHTHGEYIVDRNNNIFLVECANRGGGVYTSSTIVPELTEINLNEILINQSLDKDNYSVLDNSETFMKRSIMLTFLDFEVGRVIKNINFKDLDKLDYVLHYRSIYAKNDMVEHIDNCASRHSMLVIKGRNTEETYDNLRDFESKMEIEYYDL